MIAKEKTTFKTYRDNKGKDQVLHQGQGRVYKEERKNWKDYPPPLQPRMKFRFVGENVVVAHWITKFAKV